VRMQPKLLIKKTRDFGPDIRLPYWPDISLHYVVGFA
jgi:hypothetical protein